MSDTELPSPKSTDLGGTFERLFARRAGHIASPAFVILILFVSFESAPGWGWLDLGFGWVNCLLVGGLAGMIAGFLAAERRLFGAIALGICGAGAVGTVAMLLHNATRMPNWIIFIAMLIGLLPGLAFYWVVERVLGRPTALTESANQAPAPGARPEDATNHFPKQ